MKQITLYPYFLALGIILLAHIPSIQATVTPFPQDVITQMATRQMRYHHYLWHQVRENWNKFPNATKTAFTNIGWAPPNPARKFDPVTGAATAILDNYSGEDFLYMHRQMIANANSLIAQYQPSYGNIQGWTTLPAPGDADYPVPANYTVPNNSALTSSTSNQKTDSFYKNTLANQEKTFKDPVKLRNMTLAQLGATMEVTIHSYLHMRFSAANPIGYRNSYKGTIPMIDKMWDNVTYNWLGDTYSSHVNPVFWKIHGWIDARIEDWRVANNLSAITWKGTWTGGPMSTLGSVLNAKQSATTALRGASLSSKTGSSGVGDVMQQALQLLIESGVPEAGPGDEVKLPPLGIDLMKQPKPCNKKKTK